LLSVMAILEGMVRQSTQNRLQKFELVMLETGRDITGYSVLKPEDSVMIETEEGSIPVYMFKMNRGLHELLAKHQEVWDV